MWAVEGNISVYDHKNALSGNLNNACNTVKVKKCISVNQPDYIKLNQQKSFLRVRSGSFCETCKLDTDT